MTFNEHTRIRGAHSFLSPSRPAFINYDEEKLMRAYRTYNAAIIGTKLHKLAEDAINLGVRLEDDGSSISMYVNDCIKYGMQTEVAFYYSENCFGHADAANFADQTLYIFDLKTGLTPCSGKQLEVYAAIFCLEYGVSPFNIDFDLRIYQRNKMNPHIVGATDIQMVMDKIIVSDRQIKVIKGGG